MESFHSPAWRKLAVLIRYTRIPFLIASVYALGYQKGIVDCTKSPVALQGQILQYILMQLGMAVVDDSTVVVISDDNKRIYPLSPHILTLSSSSSSSPSSSSARHTTAKLTNTSTASHVAYIARRLIGAAREYVQEQLEEATETALQRLPTGSTPQQQDFHLKINPSVQHWRAARERLMGEDLSVDWLLKRGRAGRAAAGSSKPWQYWLIDCPLPNAFVTELLPQRLFLTSGLLDLVATEDELAVVLGHEVAHFILGHNSQATWLESVLRSLEICLLTLDPTSGVIALFVMGGLAWVRSVLSASNSREHEYEADQLGVSLATRACFNTQEGIQIMRKLHEYKVKVDSDKQTGSSGILPTVTSNPSTTTTYPSPGSVTIEPSLLETHPPTLERYERMQQLALKENMTKYRNCCKMSTQLYNAWYRKMDAKPW